MLSVEHLKTYFNTSDGIIRAVDDVSFHIASGSTLGLVGESGCGKSVTALSLIRLIDKPIGRIKEGRIIFNNKDLLKLSERDMQKVRGNDISMVFQEPMTSLNPVYTIGDQLIEILILHQKLSSKLAIDKAIEVLSAVKIPDPSNVIKMYPHQLSGGMLQRVMIAMAISCKPFLLIADEPTTALDVTIQAQILDLLSELKDKYQLSLLLITHDFGIVAEIADRIAVMYNGKIVEEGTKAEIFKNPCHPYTVGLLEAVPRIDRAIEIKSHLNTIKGSIPEPYETMIGCNFEPRCEWSLPICKEAQPQNICNGEIHSVQCFLYEKQKADEVDAIKSIVNNVVKHTEND